MTRLLATFTSPYPHRENITDGPGYRAYTLFQQLRRNHEVVLLSLYESFHLGERTETETFEEDVRIRVIRHQPARVAEAINEERPDVIYLPWSALPFVSRYRGRTPTVIDYVGSGLLEKLASTGSVPAHLLKLTLDSFWQGDFLMTSGSRFRHFLQGLLIASKKATVYHHDPEDPLIHLIPMSLPPNPLPIKTLSGGKETSPTLLVAGATLPWYDHETLFAGLKTLLREEVDFHVVFMGGNPRDFLHYQKVMSEAKELGDRITFTGTVPFRKRASFYRTATVGMNLGKSSVEDELSIRTRIFDYVWAGLPVVTCGRDEYSDLVLREGAGFRYEPRDPKSLSRTLADLLNDATRIANARNAMSKVRQIMEQDAARVRELEGFLRNPSLDRKRRSVSRFLPSFALYVRDFLRDVTS